MGFFLALVLFVSFFFFRVSIYLWVLDGEYNGASQASRKNIGEGPYGHAFLHIKQLFSIYSPSRTPGETSWLPYLAHSHTQETKGHIKDCHIHPMSVISFPRPDHPPGSSEEIPRVHSHFNFSSSPVQQQP